MTNLPVLITAFSRPRTLHSLLQRVETLETREVWVSIDKPNGKLNQENLETLKVASNWQKSSHHRVHIVERSKNLGIYEHLPIALNEFFEVFKKGIVLEDDIEILPEFIEFLDKSPTWLDWDKNWSVCSHNPLNTDNPYSERIANIVFRPSYFHSIWGWATSKTNAVKFIRDYDKQLNKEYILEILIETSKRITKDPFVRSAFINTWMRKMIGWKTRRHGSGWDTRWVFQAWSENRHSLVPDKSLGREEVLQLEGQTHPHQSRGVTWIPQPKNDFSFTLGNKQARLEVQRLRVWGITRPYAWAYNSRITRQLKELLHDNSR